MSTPTDLGTRVKNGEAAKKLSTAFTHTKIGFCVFLPSLREIAARAVSEKTHSCVLSWSQTYKKVELNWLRLLLFLYEAYLWTTVPSRPPSLAVVPHLRVNQSFISLRFEKLPLDFIQMKVRSCGYAAGLLSRGRFGF